MIKKRKFLSEVLTLAKSELLLAGFLKERNTYRYLLGTDVEGWLTLDTTVNEGPRRVGVYPVIGVLHGRLEKIVQEFSGVKDRNPTLTIQLGYLMPQETFLTWILEPPPFDWIPETKRMVQAVEIYGVPFMKSNASLEVIIDHLERHRYSDRESAAYRVPVAYLLAGKTDLALEHARKHLAELGKRTDPAALQYKTFAAKFLQEATSLR